MKKNKFILKLLRSPRTIRSLLLRIVFQIKRFLYANKNYIRNQINLIILKIKYKLKIINKIKISFFVVHASTWNKIDSIYQVLKNSSIFDVSIVICPVVDYGVDNMLQKMNEFAIYFQEKGYKYQLGYDCKTEKYLDVKKYINPDVIFYNNPYKGLIHDDFYIDNFLHKLTCYVPYYFGELSDEFLFNLDFHNKVWRYYLDSESNMELYNKKLGFKRKNHKVVGYSMFDNKYKKTKNTNFKKTIIWSPHHSISQSFALKSDSFILLSTFMIKMIEKYPEVYFVFRPHPLLKTKLYNHNDWGKYKTDDYYSRWNTYVNSRLSEEPDYRDLFYSSDALIHDCASYRIEYLITLNRVLFIGEKPSDNISSEIGINAMNCHEFAQNTQQVEQFILSVLDSSEDKLYNKKEIFVEKYLLPYKGNMASYNVFSDLKEKLL